MSSPGSRDECRTAPDGCRALNLELDGMNSICSFDKQKKNIVLFSFFAADYCPKKFAVAHRKFRYQTQGVGVASASPSPQLV